MTQRIAYTAHFISNISFNSDHQVLDSGGWGPLSLTVPFSLKDNIARLFFPKYKPSVTLFPYFRNPSEAEAPLPLDSLGGQAASVGTRLWQLPLLCD